MRRIVIGVWAAWALVGCGPAEAGDAGTDASVIGDGGHDAATAPDAAVLPDAGPPDAGPPDAGPADAGPPDADRDGVPDERDCAPDDDSIGATSSRDCSTACGGGTEECAEGVWAACSAPTACLCDTPGGRRVVPCGMCGEQSEECTDGTWQPVSSCLNQGPCVPGSVETQNGFRCRVDERLCRADCTWSEWGTVTPSGECTPGSRECSATFNEDMLCTAECTWIDNPDCDVNP